MRNSFTGVHKDVCSSIPYGAVKNTRSYATLLILLGIIYVAYYEARFGGLWIENDTAVFIGTTKSLIQHGNVFYPGQYSHGPGYTAWLAMLSLSTGLSVTAIDTLVVPFIGMVMFLASVLLLYRTVLYNDEKYAAVAVLLLFLVPDLMFTVIRGNHEKLNIPYIVFAAYSVIWFAQSKLRKDYRNMAISTLMYFVCVFMNGITNDYFGLLLVFAAVITATVLIVLRLAIPRVSIPKLYIQRLWTLTLISGLVMLWVIVFVFPQSNGDTSLAQTASAKLKNLFVTQQVSSNPYTLARQQWISPLVAHVFAGFHWAVILISSLSVLYILLQVSYLKRSEIHDEELFGLGVLIAYGVTVIVAIPIDFLGLAAGSNLELRNFTYFSLFAPPVILSALRMIQVPLHPKRRRGHARRWRYKPMLNMTVAITYVVIFSVALLKSTVDPTISRLWMNYSPDEREALRTFGMRTHDAVMWAGADNRLPDLFHATFPESASGDKVVGFGLKPYVTYILVSPTILAADVANGTASPPLKGMNRMFDDGLAQIYQNATATPFTY